MRLRQECAFRRHAIAVSIGLLALAGVLRATAQEPRSGEGIESRAGPRVLLTMPLEDLPGMRLALVELASGPNPNPPSTPDRHRRGHRHPGTVVVHVIEGAMRLALEGGPVKVVRAGETFVEPPMAHHTIAENASSTAPSRAIAFMLVPDGEPLSIPEPD